MSPVQQQNAPGRHRQLSSSLIPEAAHTTPRSNGAQSLQSLANTHKSQLEIELNKIEPCLRMHVRQWKEQHLTETQVRRAVYLHGIPDHWLLDFAFDVDWGVQSDDDIVKTLRQAAHARFNARRENSSHDSPILHIADPLASTVLQFPELSTTLAYYEPCLLVPGSTTLVVAATAWDANGIADDDDDDDDVSIDGQSSTTENPSVDIPYAGNGNPGSQDKATEAAASQDAASVPLQCAGEFWEVDFGLADVALTLQQTFEQLIDAQQTKEIEFYQLEETADVTLLYDCNWTAITLDRCQQHDKLRWADIIDDDDVGVAYAGNGNPDGVQQEGEDKEGSSAAQYHKDYRSSQSQLLDAEKDGRELDNQPFPRQPGIHARLERRQKPIMLGDWLAKAFVQPKTKQPSKLPLQKAKKMVPKIRKNNRLVTP